MLHFCFVSHSLLITLYFCIFCHCLVSRDFFFFQPPLAGLLWHEIELPHHAGRDSYEAAGRTVHSLQTDSLAHFTAEQLSVTIS